MIWFIASAVYIAGTVAAFKIALKSGLDENEILMCMLFWPLLAPILIVICPVTIALRIIEKAVTARDVKLTLDEEIDKIIEEEEL